MKKLLLSSAAIVAFAGAAAAEVGLKGSVSMGYNDDYEDGFFVDADVDLSASAELNNGWTATLTYGFELEDIGASPAGSSTSSSTNVSVDDNLTISISNDMFALTYGDTEFAPVEFWDGVSDMASDGFSEQDGEDVFKVTGMYGAFEGGVSGAIDPTDGEFYGLGFGAKATFGNFWATLAYQEETDAAYSDAQGDYNFDEIFGISVGTTLAGAELTLAYASDETAGTDSTGIEVAYPIGPVTLGAFYVSESAQDDGYGVSAKYEDGPIVAKVYYKEIASMEEYGIGAQYDLGNGLTVGAGFIDGDSTSDDDFGSYILAEYDLGGGASFLASYADSDNGVTDDVDTVVGDYELYSGATLKVSLKF